MTGVSCSHLVIWLSLEQKPTGTPVLITFKLPHPPTGAFPNSPAALFFNRLLSSSSPSAAPFAFFNLFSYTLYRVFFGTVHSFTVYSSRPFCNLQHYTKVGLIISFNFCLPYLPYSPCFTCLIASLRLSLRFNLRQPTSQTYQSTSVTWPATRQIFALDTQVV